MHPDLNLWPLTLLTLPLDLSPTLALLEKEGVASD